MLYTHDETITDLCARLREIGERDTQMHSSCGGDGRAGGRSTRPTSGSSPAATWTTRRSGSSSPRPPLAKIEVIGRRLLADREVIPQALKLNPAFFKTVYADLLNTKKTRKNVQAALDAVDAYLADARRPRCSGR